MSGQKKAITPKAMATRPRSSNSHQFSASALNKADTASGMRGPDSACVDIVFLPRSLKVAFGLEAASRTPTSHAGLLVFPHAHHLIVRVNLLNSFRDRSLAIHA